MANNVKKVWASGKAVVNGWLAIPSGFSAEVIAQCGFDSVTVDMQHGVQDYQSMVQCFQAMHAPSGDADGARALERARHHRQGARRRRLWRDLPDDQHQAGSGKPRPVRQISAARHALQRPDPFRHVWLGRHLSADRQRRDRAAADDGDQDGDREHGIDPRRPGHRRRLCRPVRSRLLLRSGAEARSRRAGNPQDLREDRQANAASAASIPASTAAAPTARCARSIWASSW